LQGFPYELMRDEPQDARHRGFPNRKAISISVLLLNHKEIFRRIAVEKQFPAYLDCL
jgi:hypothetical protein